MEIKETNCFKCTDGSIFEDKDKATLHQHELNAKHELTFLVQDNCYRGMDDGDILDFIWEHRYKIGEILNF